MLRFLASFFVLFTLISPAQALELNAEQKQLAEKLRGYLNELKTLESNFIQMSSNGAFAEGMVYMQRPGKMRLIYNPPQQTEIIVRNGSIIYHDKEFKQVTYYPLSSTPLGVLLQDQLSFEKDVEIIGLDKGPGVIELSLINREDPGMGSVTLVFADQPLDLRKWSITDAQGIVTDVALINKRDGFPIEKKYFEFDDPQYDQRDN